MKCTRYQKFLMPYAEGTLQARLIKPLEEHLAGCESCSMELAQLRQTVNVLRQTEYPTMEPAFDLKSRVMARIAHEPAPARKSWWPAYSAAAAALLIFAVVMVTVQPVFYRARQASRFPESAMTQSMPKGESPTLNELPRNLSKGVRVSPQLAAPSPTVGQPESRPAEAMDIGTSGRSGDDLFYDGAVSTDRVNPPSDYKRTVPEGHPSDVAQAPYGGAQQTPAGTAGPAGPVASSSPTLEKEALRGAGNVSPAHEKSEESNKLYVLRDTRIPELEKKLREFPNSRAVMEDLLKAYRDAGRANDEYTIAERLTKLDADNPQYWFARGQAAERAGKPHTAAASYRRAVHFKLAEPDLDTAKNRLEALKADETTQPPAQSQ